MKSNRTRVLPLHWEEHHVQGNGWNGFTSTGAHIVYVYQPTDMRCSRIKSYWLIYQYWGANNERCLNFGNVPHPRTGKPKRYKTAQRAKTGAQWYWRREVLALVSKGSR